MRADEIDEDWDDMEQQREKMELGLRLDSTRVKPGRGDVFWVLKVWSTGSSGWLSGLWSWEPTRERDDMRHGETFFRWSEQADQATPMRRTELRGRLGQVDESGQRHLQEEDPLSAFQQGQGCSVQP